MTSKLHLLASAAAVFVVCGYTSSETAKTTVDEHPEVRYGVESVVSKFARQKQVEVESLTLLLLGGCSPFELRGTQPTAAMSVIVNREVTSMLKHEKCYAPVVE